MRTYGNATELWGRSWTASELSNVNSRARLQFISGEGNNFSVDHVRMRIYYEEVDMVDLKVEQVAIAAEDPINGTVDPYSIPGSRFFYDTTATNLGNQTAENVIIATNVPPDTLFLPGSIKLDNISLTDIVDADAGHYDNIEKKVIVNAGDIAGFNDSAKVTYEVILN